MVKRELTVGGLISYLASVERYHNSSVFFPTCNFFMEYDPRFSVAPFQDRSGGGRNHHETAPSLS